MWTSFYVHRNPRTDGTESILQNPKIQQNLGNLSIPGQMMRQIIIVPSHESVNLLLLNLRKSEMEPKQVFEFVGYQYDLLHGLVKPTQNRGE